MNYLLDSHTWLWWLAGDPRLGNRAARVLSQPDSGLYLSAATAWELTIKVSLGKLVLQYSLDEVLREQRVRHQVHWLDISLEHCRALAPLPFHHRDPFDRLLIAQALCEGMALLSADSQFDAYSILRVWSD